MNNQSKDKKPLKTNRNQLIQRYLFIFLFHLLFILVIGYFISPWSKVETITVEGNQAVYDQLIIEKTSIAIGDSVLKSRQKFQAIEKNISKELKQIARADVSLEGMNEVVVQVDEFETVAYIAQEGSYLRVLEDGSVLDEPYTISLGNQLILSKFEEGKMLNLMIDELKDLKKPILNLISEIELVEDRENPLFIRVYMNNGNRLLAKIPEFAEKISYYPQMVQAVEGKKGVFDMEAGIYFTPFKDDKDPDLGVNEDDGQNLDELAN